MKKGFTLAEVLITLGIIGVVAAMTIPTLVANFNERSWNTAAKVFDRKLEEALKTMNTQQTLAGHTSTLSFVTELSKHFKTNKVCKNNELMDCFSDSILWGAGEATPEEVDMADVKLAKNFGQNDWDTEIIGAQFANGVSALIAYNPACSQDPYSNQVTGSDCLAILYDTSGAKAPNASTKDLRSKNVISLGGKNCVLEYNGVCFGSAFVPTAMSNAECEARKSELGLTSCIGEYLERMGVEDRYAGTVAACGGITNMPTGSDLTALAKYLYNDDSITSSIDSFNSGVTLDQEKAASLGFTGTSFILWTNEEDADSPAYRAFSQDRTYYTSDYDGGTGSRFGGIGSYPQICVYH